MHYPRTRRWTAPTLLAAAVGLLSWAAVQGADGDDLVPLPIKLPKPQAHGTPKDTLPPGCEDVEPVSKKPRPIPKVLRGTANQALQKKVTTSSRSIISGSLDLITDGNNEGYEENVVVIKPKLQWVQIDLGAAKTLSYIAVWHYHYESVIFHDVVVQVSNYPDFVDGVTTSPRRARWARIARRRSARRET